MSPRAVVDRISRIILAGVSAAVIYSAAAAQFQPDPTPPPARAVAFSR